MKLNKLLSHLPITLFNWNRRNFICSGRKEFNSCVFFFQYKSILPYTSSKWIYSINCLLGRSFGQDRNDCTHIPRRKFRFRAFIRQHRLLTSPINNIIEEPPSKFRYPKQDNVETEADDRWRRVPPCRDPVITYLRRLEAADEKELRVKGGRDWTSWKFYTP